MDKIKGYLSMVGRASFFGPQATDTQTSECALVTTVDVNDVANYNNATGALLTLVAAGQPDVPRTIDIYIVDANGTITGGTVRVSGFDQNGVAQYEDYDIFVPGSAGGHVHGSKAFSFVSSVLVFSVTGTAADGDTIGVGFGNKIGLTAQPGAIYGDVIAANFNGTAEVGSFDRTYGTYTPVGTLADGSQLEILFTYKLEIPA